MNFIDYYRTVVGRVKIVPKHKSLFMKFLSLCLRVTNKVHLTNIGDFYDYVTTVGNTIYGPPSWNEGMIPNSTLLHELTHVLESKSFRFYYLQYLLSKNKRALFESICIQTEMLYQPHITHDMKYWEKRAHDLERYGCEYAYSYQLIKERALEVMNGTPNRCAIRVYTAYRTWFNLELEKN